MGKIVRFLGVALLQLGFLLLAAQPAHADGTQAVVNSDYVQVREKPDVKARSLGFLYKNMLVEIKTQTQTMVKVGKDSFYWFEVKGPDVSGWVYGKFLTPHTGGWDVDTYDAPGNVDWLATRFGESTWYYQQKLDMTSFSMDDYRNLMVAAANGNEAAWDALLYTILTHLKDNPYDANYAYLKKRLYSEEYLTKLLDNSPARVFPPILEYIPVSGKLLKKVLDVNPDAVFYLPAEAWQDPTVVAEIKSRCAQYGYASASASGNVRGERKKAKKAKKYMGPANGAPAYGAQGAGGVSDEDLRTSNSQKIAEACQR